MARGELRRALWDAEAPDEAVAAAQAVYEAVPASLARLDDIDQLAGIADRLKAALIGLQKAEAAGGEGSCGATDSMPDTSNMSPACDMGVTRHIHTTSNPQNVTCIASPAVPAESDLLDPDKSGSFGLGDEPGRSRRSVNPETAHEARDEGDFDRSDGAKLSADVLYRAASENFRMYADVNGGGAGGSPGRVAFSDIVLAGEMMRREMRIRDAAWVSAGDALGQIDRAVAVLILDRNASHPVYPVKNPGGALIGMLRKHREGELRLASSIIGILERDREGVQA